MTKVKNSYIKSAYITHAYLYGMIHMLNRKKILEQYVEFAYKTKNFV